MLHRLPDELQVTYDASEGEVFERLFPRAYLDPTEEEAEREWQALVHPDLLAQRLANLDAVRATFERFEGSGELREATLVDEEPDAWLAMLNDARLALGTRLGVTEETDLETASPDHADAGSYAVYGWLTFIEGELVEALLE